MCNDYIRQYYVLLNFTKTCGMSPWSFSLGKNSDNEHELPGCPSSWRQNFIRAIMQY